MSYNQCHACEAVAADPVRAIFVVVSHHSGSDHVIYACPNSNSGHESVRSATKVGSTQQVNQKMCQSVAAFRLLTQAQLYSGSPVLKQVGSDQLVVAITDTFTTVGPGSIAPSTRCGPHRVGCLCADVVDADNGSDKLDFTCSRCRRSSGRCVARSCRRCGELHQHPSSFDRDCITFRE